MANQERRPQKSKRERTPRKPVKQERLVPKVAPPRKPEPATAEELAALERQFAK